MIPHVATQLQVDHALMVAATEQARREGISRAEFTGAPSPPR
jgi:hypothetical protein